MNLCLSVYFQGTQPKALSDLEYFEIGLADHKNVFMYFESFASRDTDVPLLVNIIQMTTLGNKSASFNCLGFLETRQARDI